MHYQNINSFSLGEEKEYVDVIFSLSQQVCKLKSDSHLPKNLFLFA